MCLFVILTVPKLNCLHISLPSNTKDILGSCHISPYLVIGLASSPAYFLRSSLLRHNLHTIGFNILNYTVHCVYHFVTTAILVIFITSKISFTFFALNLFLSSLASGDNWSTFCHCYSLAINRILGERYHIVPTLLCLASITPCNAFQIYLSSCVHQQSVPFSCWIVSRCTDIS